MPDNFLFDKMVLQPISLCNFDCKYCYLPARQKNLRMDLTIAEALANQLINTRNPVSLIWHGGEPLTLEHRKFRELLWAFEPLRIEGRVKHYIQTNASLIDEEWIRLFKDFDVKVGVSLDGPEWANAERVDRAGQNTFKSTMWGIQSLNANGIRPSVIAVVSTRGLTQAGRLFSFFSELRISSLGINIEEVEGVNTRKVIPSDNELVKNFWRELFLAWQNNPVFEVREFSNALAWMKDVLNDNYFGPSKDVDLIPTISWRGDVTFLSPELSGFIDERYNNFIVGNILNTDILSMVAKAREIKYVMEYLEGRRSCRETCDYWSFCGGGHASNKYFETGLFATTETLHCLSSKKMLVDALLEVV